MTKRCLRCKHFLAADWHHKLCRACRKVIKWQKALSKIPEKFAGKSPVITIFKDEKPTTAKATVFEAPIYLGKQEECEYCGKTDHLYSTKKSAKKVCLECKRWLEDLIYLPNI